MVLIKYETVSLLLFWPDSMPPEVIRGHRRTIYTVPGFGYHYLTVPASLFWTCPALNGLQCPGNSFALAGILTLPVVAPYGYGYAIHRAPHFLCVGHTQGAQRPGS